MCNVDVVIRSMIRGDFIISGRRRWEKVWNGKKGSGRRGICKVLSLCLLIGRDDMNIEGGCLDLVARSNETHLTAACCRLLCLEAGW